VVEVLASNQPSIDAFAPLLSQAPSRRTATALAAEGMASVDFEQSEDSGTPAIVGTLIHRALAAGWLLSGADDPVALARLLRSDERALAGDLSAVTSEVFRALASLRANPTVRELFDDSTGSVRWRRYEVPFSLHQENGVIVRGQIDCLAARSDGTVEVLEIKSGRRSPAHLRQLDIYLVAARGLIPDTRIEGRIIYAQ
jgi:hypothetical protein